MQNNNRRNDWIDSPLTQWKFFVLSERKLEKVLQAFFSHILQFELPQKSSSFHERIEKHLLMDWISSSMLFFRSSASLVFFALQNNSQQRNWAMWSADSDRRRHLLAAASLSLGNVVVCLWMNVVPTSEMGDTPSSKGHSRIEHRHWPKHL